MSRTGCRNRGPGSRTLTCIILLLALAFGVTAPGTGCGGESTSAPVSRAGMTASRATAESYLTGQGKAMAAGRTDGATIYSVTAALDVGEHSVRGDESVLYTNRSTDMLTEVVFRVYANAPALVDPADPVRIESVTVDGRRARNDLDGSLLEIELPGGLRPGGDALIRFRFEEPVPEIDGVDGVYGYSGGTYDLGNFLPTVVAYSGGSWDRREPPPAGDVAFFDCSYYTVSFEAPRGYTVAATGLERGSSGNRHLFHAGPVRDFQVQACDSYRSSRRAVEETVVTSYFDEDHRAAGLEALDSACASLELFSERFGPYPYDRFNVCEAPLNGAAGMEFTGQVLIASSEYEDPTDTGDQDITIAHETAHQWWALVVGSDSIGHPWVDESLTSYNEVLYSRWRYGAGEAEPALEDIADNYNYARDEDLPDAVVDQPVADFLDDDQYTAIVYGKGALFFNAAEKSMGEPGLEQALRDYYGRYAFLNASGPDLAASLRSASPDPVSFDALYARWITELHGDEDVPH